MRRLLLVVMTILISFASFAQTRAELYDSYNNAISKKDLASLESLITNWEKLYPNDAELYSVRANYYFQDAVNDVIVMSGTPPTDGRKCILICIQNFKLIQ